MPIGLYFPSAEWSNVLPALATPTEVKMIERLARAPMGDTLQTTTGATEVPLRNLGRRAMRSILLVSSTKRVNSCPAGGLSEIFCQHNLC